MSRVQVCTEIDTRSTTGICQGKADGAKGLQREPRSPPPQTNCKAERLKIKPLSHNRNIGSCMHLWVLGAFVESLLSGTRARPSAPQRRTQGRLPLFVLVPTIGGGFLSLGSEPENTTNIRPKYSLQCTNMGVYQLTEFGFLKGITRFP